MTPASPAAELRRLVVGAIDQAEAGKLPLDARLRDRPRQPVQSGMEQQVAGDRELEIERRLLEHDAEPRQRRRRLLRDGLLHHHPVP